jgi:hypothetical protein
LLKRGLHVENISLGLLSDKAWVSLDLAGWWFGFTFCLSETSLSGDFSKFAQQMAFREPQPTQPSDDLASHSPNPFRTQKIHLIKIILRDGTNTTVLVPSLPTQLKLRIWPVGDPTTLVSPRRNEKDQVLKKRKLSSYGYAFTIITNGNLQNQPAGIAHNTRTQER